MQRHSLSVFMKSHYYVSVKFVLMPSGQVATLRCHLGQTLHELRDHFSNELKMPENVLVLLFDGEHHPTL